MELPKLFLSRFSPVVRKEKKMSDDESLDDVRRRVLDMVDTWDSLTRWMFGLACAAELGLGIALIWLTDFSDPLQRLIFLAVATIYAPLIIFIAAITCRAEQNSQRILKAIDLLQKSPEGEE
jgi:hypothetical protein